MWLTTLFHPEGGDGQPPNNMPALLRWVVQIGVLPFMALLFAVFMMRNVTDDLKAIADRTTRQEHTIAALSSAIEAHATQTAQDRSAIRRLLWAICLNTAKTSEDRRECVRE